MPAFTKTPEEMIQLFERALKYFPMATQRAFSSTLAKAALTNQLRGILACRK